MNYCSRITIQSKTCEGVSYTLKKLNEKRRVQREMTVAEIRTRLIDTQRQLKDLIDQASPAENLLTSDEQAIEKAATEYKRTAVPVVLDNPDHTEVQKTAAEYAGMETLLAALKAERQKSKELRDATPAPLGQLDKTNAAFDEILHAEWYPAWIKWGLYSIQGLEIDDAPATVETLIDAGPPELVSEIFKAIQEASGLSAISEKS